jgi:hypothetical protein
VHAAADYDLYLRIARRHPIVGARRGRGRLPPPRRMAMSRNAAVMLRTTLAVHRRQRRHARRDARHLRAYREGRRFWQHFFGDQLMDEIRAGQGPGGRPAQSMLGLVTMARCAPRRLAWHAGRWLRNSRTRLRLTARTRQP